jgi:4,5-DOPA dioxygenase extradiol
MRLDTASSPQELLALGRKLRPLREEGVLILGSGNVVHNLRRISFDEDAPPADWAVEFEGWVKTRLEARDFAALAALSSPSARLAVPTPDHFAPLLYVAGASDERDSFRVENEGIQNASISMLSVSWGQAFT